MNFYIGNIVSDVDLKDINVYFSDDLSEYIYSLRNKISYDLHKLFDIDPYNNVLIKKEEVREIVEICKYLQSLSLFEDYDSKEEAMESMETLNKLIELGQLAITKGMGLVSIGD